MFRFNRAVFIFTNYIISFFSFLIIFIIRYSNIDIIGVGIRSLDTYTISNFLFYSLIIITVNISLKIYEINKISRITESFLSNIFTSIISMGVIGIVYFFTQLDFARFVFFSGFLIIPILLSLFNKILFNVINKKKKPVNILFLGVKSNYILFKTLVNEYSKWFKINITEVLSSDNESKLKNNMLNSDLIVVDTDHAYPIKIKNVLNNYEIEGGKIYSLADMFSYFDQSLPAEIIKNNHYEIFTSYKLNSFYNLYMKRLFDLFFSLLLLIITLPVSILTIILIKTTSKGNLIFKQQRLTIKNKTFMMYKFRSMKSEYNLKEEIYFTDKNDPRITFIGKIIRSLRIDEIPQLINIIKGDMSLIGPRPERPELIKKIIKECPLFKKRLLIKPGLTGWAQVKYNYVNNFDLMNKKLSYDLFYINNLSFTFDMKILLYTLETIIFRRGAV